jgi:alkylation response protein AidB-like acyl-CoA dehydrogenase
MDHREPAQRPRHAAEALVAEHWHPEVTLRQWWSAMADAGLSHPTWPRGFGGSQCSPDDARVVIEVLAASGTIAPPSGGIGAALAAPTLLEYGTRYQVEQYLPDIARGVQAWCQLFSEPGAGSDLASLSARAVRTDGGWSITGQKVWTSGADLAQRGLLLARTGQGADRHEGITMFALNLEQSGVEIRPLRQMNGETRFCEVFLDGVVASNDEVIGVVGDGWRVAKATLRHERQSVSNHLPSGLVPVPSGTATGILDRPVAEVLGTPASLLPVRVEYALPWRLFARRAATSDRPVSPTVRDELVRYRSATRINRMTVQRFRQDRSTVAGATGPVTKLRLVDSCRRSSELVFDLLGAAGMLAGAPGSEEQMMNRSALGSPGARLGGGTDEIQKNILAERALGLPRDPS